MKVSNSQIRARARYLLDGNVFGADWLKSVLIALLMASICGAMGFVFFFITNKFLLPLLLGWLGHISPIFLYGIPVILSFIDILALNIFIGPLSVGMSAVHLDLVRGNGHIRVKKFFDEFKNFGDNFLIGFMYMLHTTLWTCIFIFPGIYVGYSYAMVFHVKRDHPEYRWQQCVDESERLMEGNRWRLFKLHLSFMGWSMLGAFAFFGLGTLWVQPYQQVSLAVFYEQILAEKESNVVNFDKASVAVSTPVSVDL